MPYEGVVGFLVPQEGVAVVLAPRHGVLLTRFMSGVASVSEVSSSSNAGMREILLSYVPDFKALVCNTKNNNCVHGRHCALRYKQAGFCRGLSKHALPAVLRALHFQGCIFPL